MTYRKANCQILLAWACGILLLLGTLGALAIVLSSCQTSDQPPGAGLDLGLRQMKEKGLLP